MERRKMGKALRKSLPRRSHGDWQPSPDRPDPVSLLQAQDEGRLQHLLPIKYGRMVASPFAFLRGSAVVMASDLATAPVTGFDVVLCGDAHLDNFGLFATPERNRVFDINDFDEAYPGPWEWDLKRLANSAVVAGRANGFADNTCLELASNVSRSYRRWMRRFASMSILDVWYFQIDADSVVELINTHAKKSAKHTRKAVKKARSHTSQRTLDKLTEVVDGKRQFIDQPPLLVPLLSEQARGQISEQDIERAWQDYVSSVSEEKRQLLARFRIADAALRVGGVGSVGTRCTVLLLEGDTEADGLILQQKEANPSVLEPYLQKRMVSNQAHRVVVGQRLMQAQSDMFLGWIQAPSGTHYYWRQLKDMKGSFDTELFDAKGMNAYLRVCAACLARAHARTGGASLISGYMGSSNVFNDAIAAFAAAYADQTERDYEALEQAVNAGRIVAETGV
jgi:uncharacterized protein (DUF2252 family)